MKKILLLLGVITCTFVQTTKAQCNFISPTVELNEIITTSTGYCDINFNLSFEININSGNKYTFVHLWRTTDYNAWVNNPAYNAYSSTQNTQPEFNNPGGDALNILQNAVATIVLNNDNVPITFEATYGPDPDAPVKNSITNPGITVVRQTSGLNLRYTISNLIVRVPTPPSGCNSVLSFTGDAWSSQANNANPPIHCFMLGWTFTLGDVAVGGFKNCLNPLKYSINLSTNNATPFDVYYDVYVDNGDLVFNTSDDHLVVNDKGPISLSASTPYSASSQPFDNPNDTYAQPAYKDRSFWYVVTSPTQYSNLVLYEANNACATLPVEFSSFTAARNRSSVILKWETASEINNSGFAVERNLNGSWEQIAFVNSQAVAGNSTEKLSYQYNDNNNSKSITQYRIKQVDFDNKSKYTEIRSVRGLDQVGTVTVFPNPSHDGRINIVFNDASATRNISVLDMSGRTIKQINNITSNNITIDNLGSGMYNLRIVVPKTGEQFVQKLVVNRR